MRTTFLLFVHLQKIPVEGDLDEDESFTKNRTGEISKDISEIRGLLFLSRLK